MVIRRALLRGQRMGLSVVFVRVPAQSVVVGKELAVTNIDI